MEDPRMPGWTIKIEEVSVGAYQLDAAHPDGRTAAVRGHDVDTMIASVANAVATDRDFDAEAREAFDTLAASVAAADEPYWLAVEMRDGLTTSIMRSVEASRLWHIWAALEDRYELRPDERPQAEDEMRRAAREWLAIQGDADAVERYLDHWQYEVCGYERE